MPDETRKVLVIDDDDMVTDSLIRSLQIYGLQARAVRSGHLPGDFVPDIVICDWNLGMYDDRDGGQIVTTLREELPEARFIICSGLPRDVPEGVEFFSKGDALEMLNAVVNG